MRRIRGSLVTTLALLSMIPGAHAALDDTGPRIDWQWGLLATRASTVHATGLNASGVTVALIDSGVDLTHPDLRDSIWTNSREVPGNGRDDDGNGYVDDIHGWDWCTPGPAGPTGSNHGTHVAGILAARPGEHNGVQGVAPGAKIMSLRILCSNTSGAPMENALPDLDALQQAIRYARQNGAHIITMSLFWNAGLPRQALSLLPLVENEIHKAHDAGILLVAAAGNTNGGAVQSPANHPRVVAVGAIELGNGVPAYAAKGPEIELWAPGGAPSSASSNRAMILSTMPGASYGWLSGTSMAAPHVAGAAALILAQQPKLKPAEVVDRLKSTAFALPAGVKLIDVAAALEVPYEAPRAQILRPRDGQTVGPSFTPQVAFDRAHEVYTVDFLVDGRPVAYAHRFYDQPLRFELDESLSTFAFQVKLYDGRAYTPAVSVNLTHDPEGQPEGGHVRLLKPAPKDKSLEDAVVQFQGQSTIGSTPAPYGALVLLALVLGVLTRRGQRPD